MTYTITDKGIVYHITPEHGAEERITDAIEDAQALEVVKREAAKIDEALREDGKERLAAESTLSA